MPAEQDSEENRRIANNYNVTDNSEQFKDIENVGENKLVNPVPNPNQATNSSQHKLLSLVIKDLKVLYTAYMPFVINGGLFIPTKKAFNMGEQLPLVISLMEENVKYSVTGQIVWITPNNSPNRTPGIGVQFTGQNAEELSNKIKVLLVNSQSKEITNTM